MDAGSLGSCSSGGGTPSPPTLTFGSPATAHSPSARGGSSPKSGLGSLTPTRSTPESPLGAALPPPPPPPKQPGFGVLHALNGRALYGGMRPPPSPPGIPSDASATDCRLIDYRGAKIAAFLVNGEYLLCLPQAFELFLKHLVGGLHTVYTKLKRLDITPIVCNVEQVRILRGLGAIQPGVNRCKLLSCKDFDSLYKDCTTARSASRLWNAASLMGAGSSPANASYPFLSQEKRYPGEDTAIPSRSRNLLDIAELKMEVLRERNLRESLEKQLSEEQRTRVLYQKRLKKERRCRRRIQDQLELEQKKRSQYEEVLRNSVVADHRSPPVQPQPQSQPQPQQHTQATPQQQQQQPLPERVTSPETETERQSRQEAEKKGWMKLEERMRTLLSLRVCACQCALLLRFFALREDARRFVS
ncbi:uncharacterized protein LOC144175231 [Haemaphysalis longicornis]